MELYVTLYLQETYFTGGETINFYYSKNVRRDFGLSASVHFITACLAVSDTLCNEAEW